MVEACLASIARHTRDVNHSVVLVSADKEPVPPKLTGKHEVPQFRSVALGIPKEEATSKTHGKMLDMVVPDMVSSEYVLTLDSDCFPIADGWLSDLLGMMVPDVGCAGILHPWAPPSADMPHKMLEWRVRSQHCWETTHVACQLARTQTLKELQAAGVKYNGGDDTGLLIPKKLKEMGKKVVGFKPTRCPVVKGTNLDPEFNRYVCVVYGDKVYHHGGYSRNHVMKDDPVFRDSFGWVEGMVLESKGAEFLLDSSNSYRYHFQKEEAVAKEKMQRLFGMKNQRMQG
jgi:hypothetical protein